MRSRYSAYAKGLEAYLLATWHISTRPSGIDLQSSPTRWLGLKILRFEFSSETSARVEFVARYKGHAGGPAGRLHECSSFVCEVGRWYYVEGEVS